MTWFQKPPLGTPLDWENPLNDGTMLAFAMNEGHGDKVQDLSLNGNHGSMGSFAFPPTATSGWNPGHTGVGLNFDGTDDYINCGDGATLDVDAITIATIVRINSTVPTNYPLVISKTTYNSTWGIFINQAAGAYAGNLRFRWYDGAAIRDASSSGNAANQWITVVATHDGTKGRLYIDGVLKAASSRAFAPATGTNVLIGGRGGVENFGGAIDQPRIVNKAWSAKEIKDYAINPWQVYLDDD